MPKPIELLNTNHLASAQQLLIMGDYTNWSNLESNDKSNEQFLDLIQDCYLTQHVLDPIRGSNVLDLFLTSESSMSILSRSKNILQRRIITY